MIRAADFFGGPPFDYAKCIVALAAHRFARTAFAVWGYSVRPALIAGFCRILDREGEGRAVRVLIALNALVYLTALFSPLAFSIDENGVFTRGPLGYTCHVVTGVLLANLLRLIIRTGARERRLDMLIPEFNVLLVVGAVVLDTLSSSLYPVSRLNTAIVINVALYYIWLQLRFEREHEEDLKARVRQRIMLAQIQPHFLYNSLGAIKSTVCDDAERARDALDAFSQYLRYNIDSLGDDRPIPFSGELEHVRHYLSLQQLRFGDKLDVRYDLDCTNFRLLTLTLQPLVENAVTYGVRKSATGRGTVTIRSREYPERIEVSVTDDGPGFAPEEVSQDGERSHVGLQNVRDRLRLACGGELLLRSAPGAGTTATIVLPKEAKPC